MTVKWHGSTSKNQRYFNKDYCWKIHKFARRQVFNKGFFYMRTIKIKDEIGGLQIDSPVDNSVEITIFL